MTITGSFRFHPVGQGLFYSGLLSRGQRDGGGTFSFVYDCGTLSPREFLHREIDDLKLLLPSAVPRGRRRLDLFVVSHLHDDHVNGLERLLDGLEVGTVVIPYTDEATMLLARAESSYEDPFLASFYADPVNWLSSRGVQRIMLVGSPGEGQRGDNLAYPYDENGEGALAFDREGILSVDRSRDTVLYLMRDDAPASLWPFRWSFRFRNLGLPGWESYRDIVDEFQRETLLSLDDVFRSRTQARELARRLREAMPSSKSVNRTSVVLTHEPMPDDGEATSFWPSAPWSSYDSRRGRKGLYPCEQRDRAHRYCRRTILTGDVEMLDADGDPELWDSNEQLAVFQYPHHGAGNALARRRPRREWLVVFSSGLANLYGHPHPAVLEKQGFTVLVDERNPFDYRIVLDG